MTASPDYVITRATFTENGMIDRVERRARRDGTLGDPEQKRREDIIVLMKSGQVHAVQDDGRLHVLELVLHDGRETIQLKSSTSTTDDLGDIPELAVEPE